MFYKGVRDELLAVNIVDLPSMPSVGSGGNR